MKLLLNLLIGTISVFVAAQVLPGVHVPDLLTAFVVSVVLGVLNVFVKPILVLLTLPITLVTLGLFSFVINFALVLLTDYLVADFTLDSLLTAFLFSVVVSLINSFLSLIAKAK